MSTVACCHQHNFVSQGAALQVLHCCRRIAHRRYKPIRIGASMCSTEVLVVTRIRARFWQFWFTLSLVFSRERPRSRICCRDTVPVTHTTASHSNVPANCIDCSHQHGFATRPSECYVPRGAPWWWWEYAPARA